MVISCHNYAQMVVRSLHEKQLFENISSENVEKCVTVSPRTAINKNLLSAPRFTSSTLYSPFKIIGDDPYLGWRIVGFEDG